VLSVLSGCIASSRRALLLSTFIRAAFAARLGISAGSPGCLQIRLSGAGRREKCGAPSPISNVGESVGRKAFALLWRAAQQKAKPKARRKSQEPFAIVKRLLPRLSKDERAELRAELDRLE
jgi:hypothetical protein